MVDFNDLHRRMYYTPGHPNWKNLLGWLQLYHSYELTLNLHAQMDSRCDCWECIEKETINAMFGAVEYHHDWDWVRLRPMLEAYCGILVRVQGRWAKGEFELEV